MSIWAYLVDPFPVQTQQRASLSPVAHANVWATAKHFWQHKCSLMWEPVHGLKGGLSVVYFGHTLTLCCRRYHSPPGAWFLQFQLHVVELLLWCGAHWNIDVRHVVASRPFGEQSLWVVRQRCACKRNGKAILFLSLEVIQVTSTRQNVHSDKLFARGLKTTALLSIFKL